MSNYFGSVGGWFDAYSRTARLAPGLLLLLGPVCVALGAGVAKWPTAGSFVAAAASMGLPLALAEWVRRRGQRLQDELWVSWGGNPVVVALAEDGLVPARRRAILSGATGLPVDDPLHGDFNESATNAMRQLISATRDADRFPLIFAENKAYGFARNMLAVKSVGVAVSTVAAVAGLLLVFVSERVPAMSMLGTGVGAVTALGVLGVWLLYPSTHRVRAAANDYRDRLLEALDSGAFKAANRPR